MSQLSEPERLALAKHLESASTALRRAAQLIAKPNGHGGNGAPLRTDQVTARQLAAVHTLARKGHLSRDQLQRVITDVTGQRALSNLDRLQASQLIDHLQAERPS